MFLCYTCKQTEVSEENTCCAECQENLYGHRKPLSIAECQKRLREKAFKIEAEKTADPLTTYVAQALL